MTISTALSGLSLTLFCAVATTFLIAFSILISTGIVFCFVKGMNFFLSQMKGGFVDLKENVKALS